MTTSSAPDRRVLRFATMREILEDAEAMDGRATTRSGGQSGGWTPAQIVDHVARTIHLSRTGFGFTVPLLIRVMAQLMRNGMLNKPMRSGFKIPARGADELAPRDDLTWADALATLRAEVEAAEPDDAMLQRSPLLGPMTHDDWVHLHCRHAELHFSFMHDGDGAS